MARSWLLLMFTALMAVTPARAYAFGKSALGVSDAAEGLGAWRVDAQMAAVAWENGFPTEKVPLGPQQWLKQGPKGLNPYQVNYWNPVRFVDPDGRCADPEACAKTRAAVRSSITPTQRAAAETRDELYGETLMSVAGDTAEVAWSIARTPFTDPGENLNKAVMATSSALDGVLEPLADMSVNGVSSAGLTSAATGAGKTAVAGSNLVLGVVGGNALGGAPSGGSGRGPTRPLGKLEPIHKQGMNPLTEGQLKKMSDGELLQTATNPRDGQMVKVRPGASRVLDGNTRVHEMQNRMRSGSTTLRPETPIPVDELR